MRKLKSIKSFLVVMLGFALFCAGFSYKQAYADYNGVELVYSDFSEDCVIVTLEEVAEEEVEEKVEEVTETTEEKAE